MAVHIRPEVLFADAGMVVVDGNLNSSASQSCSGSRSATISIALDPASAVLAARLRTRTASA